MCWLQASSVSWLGGNSLTPRIRRGQRLAAFPQQQNAAVATNENPPYSRAAATAFHRLPVHEVCGYCRGAMPTADCDDRRRGATVLG